MTMGTVAWEVAPSFPAVLLTMLVSLVAGGAASYAFYLWFDKTDETAGGCATVQTVIVFVAAFTLLFGNATMGEHTVNVSELAHVGSYDGAVMEAKYADVKIETRYGAVVEMPREALGEDAAAGDKVQWMSICCPAAMISRGTLRALRFARMTGGSLAIRAMALSASLFPLARARPKMRTTTSVR